MLNEMSSAAPSTRGSLVTPNMKQACILAAMLAAICVNLALPARSEHLTRVLFMEQDLVVAGVALVVLAGSLLYWRANTSHLDTLSFRTMEIGPGALACAMITMIVLGGFGHTVIMHGLAFSRDEQMALFDARIFSEGRLVGTIPAAWRGLLDAMHTKFLIIPPGGENWISSYLPVNAILHAPAIKLGLTAWVNPVLAALGLFATCAVARQIWPDNRENMIVAGLLYLTSTQVWAMSMTPFAMTGHLAFNMFWLLCFIRGGRIGHMAAVLIGFVATGLHQVIFHPLFALPFCALLVIRRDWPLVVFYGAAYALIGLFWISYAKWTIYAGVPAATHELGGIWGYVERVSTLLTDYPPHRLALMAANMFRFFAWQNLLLLPLLLVTLWTLRRSKDPILIAMYAALVLTPIAMFFLLAYQGHGWGYRYMHGLIGIACLLAAAGWHQLRIREMAAQRALVVATMVTVLICAPYLLWHTRNLISGFADADREIRQLKVDLVVVDDTTTGLSPDLVTPHPVKNGRPVRLLASKVDQNRLKALCRDNSVAWVTNVGRGRTPRVEIKCR